MLENSVLYRKYRPTTFEAVHGQDHIVKVIKGSIELGRVGHAYLFSGPRGTGKTTMARIMAKEIGCSEHDIIEIDAASNRGIDDIRALKEGVLSRPFESEKKMYIIDEVHMLTKEAFNALLKTLEEPPTHVVFVLATTELHKIIPTIISRCQTFEFKSPTKTVLVKMLTSLAEKEGYRIETSALGLIALLARGSFRDAQSVMQKLISYSKDTVITQDEAELILGAPKESLVEGMLVALAEGDPDTLLTKLKQIQELNVSADMLLQMLTEKVRQVMYLRFSPARKDELQKELDPAVFNQLDMMAKEYKNINSAMLETLLVGYKNISSSYDPYIGLELAFFSIIGNNIQRSA